MNVITLDEEAIYHVARRIDAHEARTAYLRQVCGDDAALRDRIDGLLHVCEQEANFLEASPYDATAHPPALGERPGVVIGPYKLLEVVGEGGMGVVYVAEQSAPVRRRVALKVIKPGMDSKQVVARFEAERQALALMDHPNIATVLDAGATESGRPYFVMELVRGIPITDYCDRERLSVPDRLELFVLVCRAVQHAHLKGIIHRDLKPSNVLVTVVDGAAVPKVIDFGVAKATGASLTDRTLYTGFRQLIGTPLYMSPEQADLSGVDVDTRSDIYSLGVLLYELLTGTTPFDGETFRAAAFDEMRRIIREDEPPKPSTRLSSLGATISTVSSSRGSDPKRLNRAVRGEVDWIVMKALEKDRRRRYETANDFAADVTRYLTDQPVEACVPSAWYRFGKYARRHRAVLTTMTLVGLALIAGTTVSAWQALRATRAGTLARQREKDAQGAAAESRAVLQFLVHDLLGATDPEKALGRDVKVAEVLANAEKKIDTAFPDRPLVEAGVRHALASAFHALGKYDVAYRHSSRAHDLRLRLLGREHPDTMQTTANLADLLDHLGISDASLALSEEALETRRRLLGPEHPATLSSMNNLAIVLFKLDRLDEARKLHEQTLEIQRRVLGPEHPETLNSMNNLAGVFSKQGKLNEAREIYEQTLATSRRVMGPEHPLTLTSMHKLADSLLDQGKYDEARKLAEQGLEIQRRVMGAAHPETLSTHYILVMAILTPPGASDRDRARALELARQAVEGNPGQQIYWKWLGLAEYSNGHWDAAIQATEKCIELRGGHGWAFMWLVMALAHERRGEMNRAHEWYARARPAIEQGGMADTPRWLIDEAASRLGAAPPQGETRPNDVSGPTPSPK